MGGATHRSCDTKRYPLDYNQVYLDPNTGEELGRRYWGAVWPLSRENFVSFLYKLHYTMHLPEFWGSDRWGMRLLGMIAIIWTIDCFIGFYLTLPSRRRTSAAQPEVVERRFARGFWTRWKPAWKIKRSGTAYRVNFDIHRALSLWTWDLLFIIAFTAFSLNLNSEVFSPLMRMISNYTPAPFEQRTPTSLDAPIEAKLSFDDIIAKASAEGRARGWDTPSAGFFMLSNTDFMTCVFIILATIMARPAWDQLDYFTIARTVARLATGYPW